MKYGENVRRALLTITQFGIDMIVPIVLCAFVGNYLDKRFGTSWIFILMFFVGAAAGAGNIYKLARRIASDKSGNIRNRDGASPSPGGEEAFKDE